MIENSIGSLHINESLRPTGGAELYVLNLVKELQGRDIPVKMVSGRVEEPTFPHDSYFIPRVHKFNDQTLVAEMSDSIQQIIEVNDLKVVHLHNADNPGLVKELVGKHPIFRTIHDYRSICPTEFRVMGNGENCQIPVGESCLDCAPEKVSVSDLDHKTETIASLNSMDMLITASKYVKEQLRINGLPESKITVLPLFIPYIAKEQFQADANFASDMLFVGRIIYSKGLHEVIQAIKLLGSEAKLVVCGDGKERDYCKSLASELGVQYQINFNGWTDQKNIHKYLANTKILAVPSLWPEPFGLVGLEAMRHAKPVVAYDSGGISEWLENGKNGHLVPMGDKNGLADRIDYLLSHPNVSIQMGLNGRQKLEDDFSIEKHLAGLMSIYAQALNQRSLPAD